MKRNPQSNKSPVTFVCSVETDPPHGPFVDFGFILHVSGQDWCFMPSPDDGKKEFLGTLNACVAYARRLGEGL